MWWIACDPERQRGWGGKGHHLSAGRNEEGTNSMLYSIKKWLLVAVCSSGVACSFSGRQTCSCPESCIINPQVASSSPYAAALPTPKTAISFNDPRPTNLPESATAPALPPLTTVEETPHVTPAPVPTPAPAPAPTAAPAPEDKPGPNSDSSEIRVPLDGEFQRAASTDYSSIVGHLEYLYMKRQWRLRYASYAADDVLGGVVTLRGIDSIAEQFKEGMTVEVQGSLDTDSRKPSPDYFVRQLKIVE
jgi:hypothetical protein